MLLYPLLQELSEAQHRLYEYAALKAPQDIELNEIVLINMESLVRLKLKLQAHPLFKDTPVLDNIEEVVK